MLTFLKNAIMFLMTDKDFLNMIISILEVLSKSTANNIDDELLNNLRNESEKMSGNKLNTYKNIEKE